MMKQVMMRFLVLGVVGILICGTSSSVAAQGVVDPPAVLNIDSLLTAFPLESDQQVRSEEVAYDSVSSMHLTQVQGAVKLHHHANHSENLMIVRGAGRLTVGTEKFKIKAGDIVHLPRGTKHAFHNLGAVPAVIISVFSPGFDGKDRIWDTE